MFTDPVSLAEQRWGVSLKRVARGEYAGACPWCGGGGGGGRNGHRSDRFHLFEDGAGKPGQPNHPRYWCRQCGAQGFMDELEENEGLSPEERRLQAIEAEQRRAARQRDDMERRLSALERIHACTDHLLYHRQMTEAQTEYWYDQGLFADAIDKFQLGYCAVCPTDTQHRSSYTIPIMRRGELQNIRHRLTGADGGDKYRPHIAGLGIQLFNADILDATPDRVIIAEGEKKAAVLDQYGFGAVGICGKRSFMREWIDWFDGIASIVVALDPDAHASAVKLAELFPGRARIAVMPAKIDDMIVLYGAGSDDIEGFLRHARLP